MQLSGIDVIFKGVNLQRLMGGLIVTGQIALVSIVFSILFGLILGIVMTTKNKIIYFHKDSENQHLDVATVHGKVPIVKAFAGMTGEILDLLNLEQLDGLVIEALGAGNLPPIASQSLQRLLDAKVPVVLVSRCFNGIAEPVYAYEGGGVCLQNAGVFFVKELNAQKARLKLLIAINAGLTGDELRAYMEG